MDEVPSPTIAEFPIALGLPTGGDALVEAAAHAVRDEYRGSVVWKKLRCRSVHPLSTSYGQEAIFVLEVGQSIEFDWTWEGAVAFRPTDEDAFVGDGDVEDVWSGEVVEVDEAMGRLFVWVRDPTRPPCVGSFYVRPFEFLAYLDRLYNHPDNVKLRRMLADRLRACQGGVHPRIHANTEASLPELAPMWSHAWGVLWGPPGTGKTYTIGRQIAAAFRDPTERILVVSTTNKATDGAALSIGKATAERDLPVGSIVRIGKSADYNGFVEEGLEALLRDTETELLVELAKRRTRLAKADSHEEKAALRQQIQELQRRMKDNAYQRFVSPEVRVVVATSFKATTFLLDREVATRIESGTAPFTTIVLDEAGLIARAATAALSLLASRRVVIVGDSKQLAPICRMSRVIPSNRKAWLTGSALSHLQSLEQSNERAVHLLDEQHRMHPHINAMVSAYQYQGKLRNAETVERRGFAVPKLLREQPRTLWYVLDEESGQRPSIRAEKGPGNRSWVRPRTRDVLDKLFSDRDLRSARGLFLSPFKAQATNVAGYFAEKGIATWSSATIHSQQGAEADFVLFDTVNAGSTGWPADEWRRLVNVALSRAREGVVLLASRAEMRSPFLAPLVSHFSPSVLRRVGSAWKWERVAAEVSHGVPESVASNPELLGHQIGQRQTVRPVLSGEQQRLCELNLDGKPRLVRGVAGSGKTYVLAHWLVRMIRSNSSGAYWVVFANSSLHGLLSEMVQEAWRDEPTPFPWERVHLTHVREVLERLLLQLGQSLRRFGFDYDAASREYLQQRPATQTEPLCDGLFLDEAQDMGPNTIALLSALVRPSDVEDSKSRSVNIFYDNAQNIYGRSTPKWSDMGLDMRGRSTVMKESFRSTKPITEFALNVLYRLEPPGKDADHKELVERGLIERRPRNGQDWWEIRFNQLDGPNPTLKTFVSLDAELRAMGTQIVHWIREEGVQPNDICILANTESLRQRIASTLHPMLQRVGAGISVQTSQVFALGSSEVLTTTANSFKGYDAEIVVIAGVDRFRAKDKGILAPALYVAMTRSRSVLALYGQSVDQPDATKLLSVLEECLDQLTEMPTVERSTSALDDLEELTQRLGEEHRDWLRRLWKKQTLVQEPLLTDDGEILAEPLFWYEEAGKVYVCFANEPSQRVRHRLDDAGVELVKPGS